VRFRVLPTPVGDAIQDIVWDGLSSEGLSAAERRRIAVEGRGGTAAWHCLSNNIRIQFSDGIGSASGLPFPIMRIRARGAAV